MPELPEVETTRRGIAPYLIGRRVSGVVLRRPDLRWPIPPEIGELLPGQRIDAVERRAQYLLLPTAACLAAFVWLLSLHPTASGRVYAAYGGVYVAVALLWLWRVDGVVPSRWDLLGAALCLGGMAVIMFSPRPA